MIEIMKVGRTQIICQRAPVKPAYDRNNGSMDMIEIMEVGRSHLNYAYMLVALRAYVNTIRKCGMMHPFIAGVEAYAGALAYAHRTHHTYPA